MSRRLLATALLAALAAGPAWAISDEEIFRDFPFNLINPGARSLGVGGAFISLADDSTAAQANPAGLMNLRRPELFVELRRQGYDPSSVFIGATIQDKFFQGQVTAGALSTPQTSFSPAFVSFVIPFKRVAIGLSRLESLNVRTRTTNSFTIQGVEAQVDRDPVTGEQVIIGFQPVDLALTAEADIDARITQYNVALAFSLHRRFSIGLTGVAGTADFNARVDNVLQDQAGVLFTEPTLDYATRIDDSDTDFSYNVGLLWRPADWASIGAVYRKGPRFVLEQTIGAQGVRATRAQDTFGATFENVLKTPDSYGMGLSFRPAEPWTILLDVVRVNYTDLLEGYVSGLNRISFPNNEARFTVDDGNEYHAGFEKIFLRGETPYAMRLGWWSDPDHRIRAAEGSDLVAVFPPGERVDHYTAGFGVTLKTIQIDLAADVSDVSSTYVFSTIYRF